MGGTIFDPDKNFGTIKELSDDASGFISPDIETFLNLPTNREELVPAPDDFFCSSSLAEVKNLKANNNHKNYFEIPNYEIDSPPPFFRKN